MRRFLWLLVACVGLGNVGCFSLFDDVVRDRQNGRAAQINRDLDSMSF